MAMAARKNHAVSLQRLNATLKLRFFLERNQCFPSAEDLYDHLEAERLHHKLTYESIVEEGIALGLRSLARAGSGNTIVLVLASLLPLRP